MRVALIYPPPWKIPDPGALPDATGDGPPREFRPSDLDADFFQMPYGLLSLAAQALRVGHQVKLLNLSAYPWQRVASVLDALEADVLGLSCYTANRRGVAIVARHVRARHPRTHVVVGGPHVTALAKETLDHYPEIDSVAIGEGELTFLELLERLSQGRSLEGMTGLAYRGGGEVHVAPRRERIRALDDLAPPQDHFTTHLFMTSRGCPGECTFCAKNTTWGRLYRTHSEAYVLDALDKAVARLPVKMLMVKDDTFTADRKRATRICEAIVARGLRFLWSCDTRADVLNEDLLRAMRLAGCERLSLGVESGAPSILKNIRKKIKPQDVLRATRLAKSFGMQVRFFMMLGNRGETAATFKQSLEFVRAADPHQALFSCLSIYPGTDDFRTMEKNGWIDRNVYFDDDFQELKVPFDATDEDTRLMSAWFDRNKGIRHVYQPDVAACRQVLARLGEHHAAHLDLAAAYYREGELARAGEHARHALRLGYPAPGLAHNYLACIAAQRGDFLAMDGHLEDAGRDPHHAVLVRNLQTVRAWRERDGDKGGEPLNLVARHDFEVMERLEQPTLPGPLARDFAIWS